MQTQNIEVTCLMCRKPQSVKVPTEGFKKWQSGVSIQQALPRVSADDRELLISKICPKCFNKLTPPSEG